MFLSAQHPLTFAAGGGGVCVVAPSGRPAAPHSQSRRGRWRGGGRWRWRAGLFYRTGIRWDRRGNSLIVKHTENKHTHMQALNTHTLADRVPWCTSAWGGSVMLLVSISTALLLQWNEGKFMSWAEFIFMKSSLFEVILYTKIFVFKVLKAERGNKE